MTIEKQRKRSAAKRKLSGCVALVLTGAMFFGNVMTTQAVGLADVFNAKAYADKYQDLKDAFGYDEEALLNHYLTYGMYEDREVECLVDVVKYKEMYPDLAEAFGDDWDAYVEHYLTFGINEKRENFTEFDPTVYGSYEDLAEAFQGDVVSLWKHYQEHGKEEGRVAAPAPAPAPSTTLPGIDVEDDHHRVVVQGNLWYYYEWDTDVLYCIEDHSEGDAKITTTFFNADGTDKSMSVEYYYESGKIERTDYYEPANGEWVQTGRYDFSETGLVIRRDSYKNGVLQSYAILEYNENRICVKETVYTSGGFIKYVYENNAQGQNVKTVFYHENYAQYPNVVVAIATEDLENRITTTVYYAIDGSETNTVIVTKDEDGNITKQEIWEDGACVSAIIYEYDAAGNMTTTVTNQTNGRVTITKYLGKNMNHPLEMICKSADGEVEDIYTYTYDADGNQTTHHFNPDGTEA